MISRPALEELLLPEGAFGKREQDEAMKKAQFIHFKAQPREGSHDQPVHPGGPHLAGKARFASAPGVDDFLKRTSVIAYSRFALERDAQAVLRLAELEGLEADGASIRVRTGRGVLR